MSRRRKVATKHREITATPIAERSNRRELVALALILFATFLVYLPALKGARLWDDDRHITRTDLQSLSGLYRIWFELGASAQYYPLLHSAFWIEHKLWGDSVLGYHLVNVLWHMLAVTLVYWNLKKIKVPGAILAAAIFALHPVMVESVAWISEQKNTLSAVFYLSAMRVYLEFDQSRRRSHYLIALGLFVLGLFTKTVTATLPAALLLIFWYERNKLTWKRDVAPLVPFLILGAIAGILTAWVEREIIGAEGVRFHMSFLQRGLVAGRVIWFYLGKLVWPSNLIFIYPRWQIDPTVWWQWLFPAATLGVLVSLWLIRHKVRGPLVSWLYFCGTLFPVLGFLNVYPFIYSYVADHFQYLASLGMFVLAAAVIAQGLTRVSPSAQLVGVAICILLLAILGVRTSQQSRMYANSILLYRTTIARNPDCWMAYNNLGSDFAHSGHRQGAIELYRHAIALRPDYFVAYNNLGSQMAASGQLPDAIEQFQTALKFQPNYFDAHKNLGQAFANLGQLPEAIHEYQIALTLSPNDAELLTLLGIALTASGKPAQAVENFERALELRPDLVEARENLGLALSAVGKVPEAIEQFEQTLQLNENHVNSHVNLGRLLVRTGDARRAIEHFEAALRLQPNRTDVHNELGDMLRQAGRPQDAIEHYQAAVRINPDLFQTWENLAKALAIVKRPKEAITCAEHAIDLARRGKQPDAVERIGDWLKHYQAELHRAADGK